MGDSLIAVVVIVLVAILMFIFPVMTMSDRTDDITQSVVKTSVTEFVDDVVVTGKLSGDKYSKLVEKISSTGNSYDVDIVVKKLDENPGKKTTQANADAIGENTTIDYYTSQVLDKITDSNGRSKTWTLNQGDYISVSAKNTNTTLSQQFKSFLSSVTGNDTYAISASASGMVTANGTGK